MDSLNQPVSYVHVVAAQAMRAGPHSCLHFLKLYAFADACMHIRLRAYVHHGT